MPSLLDLLSSQAPSLQTRKGLILLNLQRDDHTVHGSIPERTENSLLNPIENLVPAFREVGNIIWVNNQTKIDHSLTSIDSEDEPYRRVRDDHESKHQPVSNITNDGKQARFLVDELKDIQISTPESSAFGSTSLLMTLRSKLITELFIAGSFSETSVYDTAIDAARYGIKITVVKDCISYKNKASHNRMIESLVRDIGAESITSSNLIASVQNSFRRDENAVDADDEDDLDVKEQRLSDEERGRGAQEGTMLAVDSDEDGEVVLPEMSRFRLSSKNQASTKFHQSERSRRSGFDRRLSNEGKGKGKSTVKRTLSLSHSGVARAESSKKKNIEEPWLNIIKPVPSKTPESSHSREPSSPRSGHPGLAALAVAAGLDQRTVDDYDSAMERAQLSRQSLASDSLVSRPLFGQNLENESAGSRIIFDLLPASLADNIFTNLTNEIEWQRMVHQTGEVPRLVCCQGEIGPDGSMPVYRHPSDRTIPLQPWTSWVDAVRKAAEAQVGHPLNHVLIQLYRSGTDYINEHSDKTLDIAKGSNIVNVSFGAQRTMRLRTKRGRVPTSTSRITHRIPMPHNSMIVMSLPTNAEYLHGINADKRPAVELIAAEKAFEGQRISLTFRQIGTFLNSDSTLIWGQGALGKSKDDARPVINGDPVAGDELVRAFGAENQASSIEWDKTYGAGSDVLHLKPI